VNASIHDISINISFSYPRRTPIRLYCTTIRIWSEDMHVHFMRITYPVLTMLCALPDSICIRRWASWKWTISYLSAN
jgi:hypothetical protein